MREERETWRPLLLRGPQAFRKICHLAISLSPYAKEKLGSNLAHQARVKPQSHLSLYDPFPLDLKPYTTSSRSKYKA